MRQEFIDFCQDICFGSQSCVFIPDLYDIFPIANTNTDANNLIIWGGKNRRKEAAALLTAHKSYISTKVIFVKSGGLYLRNSNLQTAPQ